MQLDYLSDIHLESFLKVGTQQFMSYWEKVLSSRASDSLLIAGDVMPLYGFERMLTPWLMKEFTKRYSCVIAVLGNHDYYSEEIAFNEVLETVRSRFPAIHFLENETYDLGEFQIFGATWWTHISERNASEVAEYMPDYQAILGIGGAPFTPQMTSLQHKLSLEALEAKLTKPTVVLTHHAPSFLSNSWPVSAVTEAFCCSDDEFIKTHEVIAAWVHGHVHDLFHYKIGNTPIYCNPHGYMGEERELDNPLKILSFSV